VPHPDQFISPIFLEPKPGGGARLILNLKELNQFLVPPHFKVEDARVAARLIQKDCFLASLDLKDAYYLVAVDQKFWHFLRFYFREELFEFRCLPFGLCMAPFVFTKIMKPVIATLRSAGLLSVLFLDDFLLLGDTYNGCVANVAATCQLLSSLGFLFSEKKCQFPPATSCQYLGFLFDSSRPSLELPQKRRENMLKLVRQFRNKKSCRIRAFAQFIGSLSSCCPALLYAWLYTKNFERAKVWALQREGGNYDTSMTLPSLEEDFRWWESALPRSFKLLSPISFDCEIFSDASLTGWGASCGSSSSYGFWSQKELGLHINELELTAAWYSLRAFVNPEKHSQVLLRVDNTTAIAYINKMGGVLSPALNKIARALWQWCEEREVFVFASYIPSAENWKADQESRRINPDTELELSWPFFRSLEGRLGRPTVDLFASHKNHKCDRYFSWFPDEGAEGVDAFTVSWADEEIYAFPPFALVLRVLQKIWADRAEGWIVVPHWPTQSWFPLFLDLLQSEPIEVPATEVILVSRDQQSSCLTSLVAGRVSRRP